MNLPYLAMEFVDYSPYLSLSSAECSPTTDAFAFTTFDQALLSESLTPSTDASVSDFHAYLNLPIDPVEAANGYDTVSSVTPATAAQLESTRNPPSTSHIEVFPSSFSFNPATKDAFNISESPVSDQSPTPSLYGESAPDPSTLTPVPLSPPPKLQRESTDSSSKSGDCPEVPPKRKRGRPRLNRYASLPSSFGPPVQRTPRLPHHQVERKYREGLNASLERLREAVPAFRKLNAIGGPGPARPSKAMILEGAIEYIQAIEKERDMYRTEIERLVHSIGDGSRDPASCTGLSVY